MCAHIGVGVWPEPAGPAAPTATANRAVADDAGDVTLELAAPAARANGNDPSLAAHRLERIAAGEVAA